jgi:hypothetical protein
MRAYEEHVRRTEEIYAGARLHDIAKRIALSSDPSPDLIVDESIQVPLMEWREARYDSLVALSRKLGVDDEPEETKSTVAGTERSGRLSRVTSDLHCLAQDVS